MFTVSALLSQGKGNVLGVFIAPLQRGPLSSSITGVALEKLNGPAVNVRDPLMSVSVSFDGVEAEPIIVATIIAAITQTAAASVILHKPIDLKRIAVVFKPERNVDNCFLRKREFLDIEILLQSNRKRWQ